MAPSPQETYGKLLVVLDQVVTAAALGDHGAVREWAALAQLDAIELGQQLGLLFDQEAEHRRSAVRAAFPDLDL